MATLKAQCVLLDIEGTVSDIRFVYDVMFPYAKQNMDRFLLENWESLAVQGAIETVAGDAGIVSVKDWLGPNWQSGDSSAVLMLFEHCQQLMSTDSKATGLKLLQGLVWQLVPIVLIL